MLHEARLEEEWFAKLSEFDRQIAKAVDCTSGASIAAGRCIKAITSVSRGAGTSPSLGKRSG